MTFFYFTRRKALESKQHTLKSFLFLPQPKPHLHFVSVTVKYFFLARKTNLH